MQVKVVIQYERMIEIPEPELLETWSSTTDWILDRVDEYTQTGYWKDDEYTVKVELTT